MELEKKFTMPKLNSGPKDFYEVSVHENADIDYMQVYVAGNQTIHLFERIEDRYGKPQYNDVQTIFTTPANIKKKGESHSISIGNNDNYMVFKEQHDPRIHIIASCSPFKFFNNVTFTCDACDNSTRSWGIQDQTCKPCL